MSVKLRFVRIGRRHRPFFRLHAVDSRAPRNGRILEKLGHYDPIEKDKDKQVVVDLERVKYWLDKGAVPSSTVSNMLLGHGIKTKQIEERQARRSRALKAARAKGVPFTKGERIAQQKQAEADAKQAEADAKAEAKAKAEADAKKEAEKNEKAEDKGDKGAAENQGQEASGEQAKSDETKND